MKANKAMQPAFGLTCDLSETEAITVNVYEQHWIIMSCAEPRFTAR